MNEEYLQLGAVAIIFLVCIREFFAYLKVKKTCANGNLTKEVKIIGENHLEHIYQEILKQTSQHEKQIELLTSIKTILEERRN